jgi:hypothetical protein
MSERLPLAGLRVLDLASLGSALSSPPPVYTVAFTRLRSRSRSLSTSSCMDQGDGEQVGQRQRTIESSKSTQLT